AGLASYAAQLQHQLAQVRQEQAQTQEQLALKAQQLTQAQQEAALKAQQLAEAQAIIADLKRELFGAKSDKLNEEQEEQLRQLLGDAQEQNQRPPPVSQEVLEEARSEERRVGKECRSRWAENN